MKANEHGDKQAKEVGVCCALLVSKLAFEFHSMTVSLQEKLMRQRGKLSSMQQLRNRRQPHTRLRLTNNCGLQQASFM